MKYLFVMSVELDGMTYLVDYSPYCGLGTLVNNLGAKYNP